MLHWINSFKSNLSFCKKMYRDSICVGVQEQKFTQISWWWGHLCFNDHYITFIKPEHSVLHSICSNTHSSSALRDHLCSIFIHNSASAPRSNKRGRTNSCENIPEYLRWNAVDLKEKIWGLDESMCVFFAITMHTAACYGCHLVSRCVWVSTLCTCILVFPQLIDIKA